LSVECNRRDRSQRKCNPDGCIRQATVLGGKQIDNEQVEHYGDTKERKGSPEQRPRVENHSKYGFGELRVKPVTPDGTNVKKQLETPTSEH